MAHTLDHTAASAGVLNRIWNAIVTMGENSARAQTVRMLNTVSDDQLDAMGVTRAQMVQRALSAGDM